MGGIHIYLDNETEQIARQMPKGELSKICQKAVKEWNNYVIDIDSLKKKISLIEEEKHSIDSHLEFMNKKLNTLTIEENKKKHEQEIQKLIEEQQEAQQEKERKINTFNTNLNYVVVRFKISQEKAKQYVEEYLNNRSTITCGLSDFIKKKLQEVPINDL